MHLLWIVSHVDLPLAFEKAEYYRREQQPKKVSSEMLILQQIKKTSIRSSCSISG